MNEKTIEQKFIEQFDIYKDELNYGVLYLKKKKESKIYVLEDVIDSDAPKFSIKAYGFNDDQEEHEKYIAIKSIIEGTKEPVLHKIKKISYDELNPAYPYAIYEAFRNLTTK